MALGFRVIYRISDTGYNKVKPDYINNEACLKNALEAFPYNDNYWYVIADNVSDETRVMIEKYISPVKIQHVNVGHGAGTFNIALDFALNKTESNLRYEMHVPIYFLENDYIHKKRSDKILGEAIDMGADYATLYDHPDKYINAKDGGNPYIDGGGELTKLLLSDSSHWKLTNSTTMTFATLGSTLLEDEDIWRKHTQGSYPKDFDIFIELRKKNRTLVSPVPGWSTHGESAWLTPLTDWEKEI